MLISCRRPEDGGQWKGTEAERITLLRQAIVAGPDYIELDLDTAPSIPRFGKTKRVVSHTSLKRPLDRIEDVFDEAARHGVDIVKFTWPTDSLDAAWPLLAAVSQRRQIPVVGLGIGRAGLTFSLLGLKHGSPWIYAALERGMEAFPGEPTVGELDDMEDRPEDAVRGDCRFGPAEETCVRILNAGFDLLDLDQRCLPIEPGSFERLPKMLDILKVHTVVVLPQFGRHLLGMAAKTDEMSRQARFADLLLKQADGWNAYNILWQFAVKRLEAALGGTGEGESPLRRQTVIIVGTSGLAQSLATALSTRCGMVSVTGPDEEAAAQMAQATGTRFVPLPKLYDTFTDVVVLTATSFQKGKQTITVSPSLFRPSMTVLDLTRLPAGGDLLPEARERGCRIVEPVEVYGDYVSALFKSLTGRELPAEALSSALPHARG